MSDFYTPTPEGPAGPKPEGEQVTPFLLGAANGLLFGLPEAGLKALGDEKVKKIVEEYKTKNPGYGAGDVTGSVGGMFIPGGAIARGASLGAKALGAGKVAEGLGKVAKVASGPMGINQGIATAAEQAIPRAVAGALEGEDLVENAKETGINLALGGAVGKAGELLGKGAKALGETGVGKTIKDEVSKTIEDAVLSGADVNTGSLTKAMNESARRLGIDKTGNMFNNVDELKSKTADFIVKNGLQNKVKREEFLSEQSPLWQKVADDYNQAPIDFSNPSIVAKIKSDPAVVQYINRKEIGPEGVDKIFADIQGNLEPYKTSFNDAKSFLTGQIREGNRSMSILGDAQKTIADTMHDLIDQQAMKLSPELAQLKADYPVIKLLKRAAGREMSIIENPLREGSDTFQKLATNAALGGTVGGVTASDDNKVAGAVGGALLAPFASRALSKVGTQALAGAAGNLPSAVKAVGPAVVAGAERGAGPAVQAGMAPQAPGAPVPFAQPLPNPDFNPNDPETATKPPTVDPLSDALEDVWKMEDPTGNIAAQSPQVKKEFLDGLRKRLVDKDGNIDYLRAAKVLTRGNADDEKNLQESYVALSKIKELFPIVANKGIRGMSLVKTKDQEIATDALVSTVAEVMKKGGAQEKESRAIVENIMNNPLTDAQEKARLVYKLLSDNAPTAFGPGGILHRVGVLK